MGTLLPSPSASSSDEDAFYDCITDEYPPGLKPSWIIGGGNRSCRLFRAFDALRLGIPPAPAASSRLSPQPSSLPSFNRSHRSTPLTTSRVSAPCQTPASSAQKHPTLDQDTFCTSPEDTFKTISSFRLPNHVERAVRFLAAPPSSPTPRLLAVPHPLVPVAASAELLRSTSDSARRILVLLPSERDATKALSVLAAAVDEVHVTHIPSGSGHNAKARALALRGLALARRPGIFVMSAGAYRSARCEIADALAKGEQGAWDCVYVSADDRLLAVLRAHDLPRAATWVVLVDTDVCNGGCRRSAYRSFLDDICRLVGTFCCGDLTECILELCDVSVGSSDSSDLACQGWMARSSFSPGKRRMSRSPESSDDSNSCDEVASRASSPSIALTESALVQLNETTSLCDEKSETHGEVECCPLGTPRDDSSVFPVVIDLDYDGDSCVLTNEPSRDYGCGNTSGLWGDCGSRGDDVQVAVPSVSRSRRGRTVCIDLEGCDEAATVDDTTSDSETLSPNLFLKEAQGVSGFPSELLRDAGFVSIGKPVSELPGVEQKRYNLLLRRAKEAEADMNSSKALQLYTRLMNISDADINLHAKIIVLGLRCKALVESDFVRPSVGLLAPGDTKRSTDIISLE
jgi:hypothetical protein